jgi:hypothetical protein
LLELCAPATGLATNAAPANHANPAKAMLKRANLRWPEKKEGRREDLKNGLGILFLFFLIIVIVHQIVAILGLFLFLFVIVLGDGVDLDGMDLHNFHFRFTFGAGQNFAFLDFIFISVNFCRAFRAPDHGENLLGD